MIVLSLFMSLTDMNGLLGRGATFLFSSSQLRMLMNAAGVTNMVHSTVLDIGAGDGTITDEMKEVFCSSISVTEKSRTMRQTLRRKGYTVLDVDQWHAAEPFDVISLLNVLDRCDKPMSLLQDIHNSLAQTGGILLLAVVLPFDPIVLKGPWKIAPTEKLKVKGSTFESSVNRLVSDVLNPHGFKLLSWTRLPYLSEGDLFEAYFVLDCALLMLQKCEQ
ncbi:protein-L-histidine N-pros-methyltransferase-like isoform X2 [Corticium candelabrum]|nr:protein-L-histidine N-pros-methyltransferase-like isoform X2 [Corticium candelabrum]